jgi:hypothetical protein
MEISISKVHQSTCEAIFQPIAHNRQWHDIGSMFSLAEVTAEIEKSFQMKVIIQWLSI